MIKEFLQRLKILLLIPTTLPSCMSRQNYGDKRQDQIFKMKYPFWLKTAEESYGVREQENSNHFVSFRVHILNHPSLKRYFSVTWIFVRKTMFKSRQAFRLHLLWELPTYPSSSIKHLADPISLGVAGYEMSVVQKHGHLRNCKFTNSFNSDSYI